MRFDEFSNNEDLLETSMIFTRSAGKTGGSVNTKQKFRCSSVPRAGKRVICLAQCFDPIDIAKRIQMKKTRDKTKIRAARKAKRTKRIDPSSLLTKILNKARSASKPKR